MRFSLLKELVKAVFQHKTLAITSFIALLFVAMSLISLGSQIRQVVDTSVANPVFFRQKAIEIISILFTFSIASFVRITATNRLANNIIHQFRVGVYDNLLKLHISYYEENATSKLQSSIIDGAQSIAAILQEFFSFFIRNAIVFISSIIFMFCSSKMLFFITFGVMLLLSVPLIFFIKGSKLLNDNAKSLLDTMAELISKTFDNIKLVYGYNLEDSSSCKFQEISHKISSANNRSSTFRGFIFALYIFFISASTTLIIWMGSGQILANKMTAGDLAAFMIYAVMSVSSLIGMLNNLAELEPSLTKFEQVLTLLNTASYEDRSCKTQIQADKFDIIFDAVNFSYPSRRKTAVLINFSMRINFGEFVALSGRSGAGKSTILSLLLKFYEPDSGIVRINDLSISEVSNYSMRQNFALVNQDSLIFPASILENITLGRFCTPQELDQSIDICGLRDALRQMPDGLETFVGQRGFRLSGGQKQRICIARSLLLKPKVLLLDEAMSALDRQSEDSILTSIRNAFDNQTVIFISHRQKLAKIFDRIIEVH